MTAATRDRDTKERHGDALALPVEANTQIYAGTLVCINGNGNAVGGSAAPGLLCVGRAEENINNLTGSTTVSGAGTAGAQYIRARRGIFLWANSTSGDAITEVNVGAKCFVVDNQTVALTDGNGTRSVAGTVYDIDSVTGGVWVDHRVPVQAGKHYVSVLLADLKGSDANVYHVAAPIAGRITKILVDLEAALVTGNATVQASIGGTNVTNGLVTCVQAASAAGSVFSATPTALNAVAQGADIALTIGGTASTAVGGHCVIEITE